MVYDIEFDASGTEYDYDINAENGEVVKYQQKKENGYKESGNTSGTMVSAPVISEDDAKQAAFTHAGVTEADVSYAKAKIDREHGVVVYEIEFRTATHEYDYDINATTGEVVKYEREYEPRNAADILNTEKNHIDSTDGSQSAGNAQEYLTESEVLLTALEHAGVKAEDAYDVSVELDNEHGKAVYEAEFKSGGYEFEYEIDASTGDVLKFDKEFDD